MGSVISLDSVTAVIFDTDGVVTDTARVHAAAWKAVFDPLLRARANRLGVPYLAFDVRADYLRHVDGRPRMEGVRDFLLSRGIELPEGAPGDDVTRETVNGIAARKDGFFLEQVRRYGVAPFPATVALVRELRRRGAATAAVSASRHCRELLARAGVAGMFDVRVDGIDAARLALPGKPHPGLFLEAARRLGVPPGRAAVVEDAVAGVRAARRGGFGLVVGVDRSGQTVRDDREDPEGRTGQAGAAGWAGAYGHEQALRDSGAHVVVGGLADLVVTGGRHERLAPHL